MTTPAKISEMEARAQALHAWFNRETGQDLPWNTHWRFRWEEWLVAGFNGPQLRRVLLYRRKQVFEGKRHMRSLALLNLLDVESFQADLGLINMRKAGKMEVDAKIALPPEEVQSPKSKVQSPQTPRPGGTQLAN